LHQKTEIVDVVGQFMWIGGDPFGAIGSLSGRLACPKGILRRFSDTTLLHASFSRCIHLLITD
jgi:hypothetical protein